MAILECRPDKLTDKIVGPQVKKLAELLSDHDISDNIVVTLGGDGSFIYSTNKYDGREKHFFLRPTGTRSTAFLADNGMDKIEEVLERLDQGPYTYQNLPRLEVCVNGDQVGTVLQDFWIERHSTTIDCEISAVQEGKRIWWDQSKLDVLIVHTAMGSTGYAHSVGSPAIAWDSNVIGIAQVAPSRTLLGRSGFLMPAKMDSEMIITLVGWKNETAKLVLDWGHTVELAHGDEVLVRPSYDTTRLIRINPEPLHRKLARKIETDLTAMQARKRHYERYEA